MSTAPLVVEDAPAPVGVVPGETTPLKAAPVAVPWSEGWTRGRVLAATLLMAAGVLALYGPWSDIWRFATGDEESSHIALVPLAVAGMIYLRRDTLKACRVGPSWVGPALVAAGWGMSHLGFYHSIQSFWHGGAVLVMLGAAVSVLGWRVLVAMWPAALLLVFLVPVPIRVRKPLAMDLQTATAEVAGRVLRLFGELVSRSGNQLLVNGKPVLVAEACNGMRMVFPLFIVVYMFCFCLPLRPGVRLALILLSPVSAVVCNVIRILPTAWLFGHASQQTAEQFHHYSGWPMIAVAFFLLMGVIKVLEWMKVPVFSKPPPVAG